MTSTQKCSVPLIILTELTATLSDLVSNRHARHRRSVPFRRLALGIKGNHHTVCGQDGASANVSWRSAIITH